LAEQTKQCSQSVTLPRAAPFPLADQPSRFDPLNLGSNSGGGSCRGGDRREREKEEYGRDVAATKFCVEQREREREREREGNIYVSKAYRARRI